MSDDSQWNVERGEHDGDPIRIRINAALKPFASRTDHNLNIGFAIP